MKKDFSTKTYIHLFIIAILGILIYSNTFDVPFLFDDRDSISENPVIKNIENFFLNMMGYEYNPQRFVGYLTFALNYHMSGLDVTGYHIVNLAVHIINAFLLYALVRLTFRTPLLRATPLSPSAGLLALCTALFFVVHPLQTQAVTYIVQRSTSLAALFYLLSLYLYARWRIGREEDPSGGSKGLPLYIFSLIAIVLAMKTKEIAFTLPLMVVLYEFCFFKQRKLLPLVPVLLTLLIIPLSLLNLDKPVGEVLSDVSEVTRVQVQISRWDYLLTQFTVIATYIRLLFLPVNQNLDYDYPIYDTFFTAPVLLSFVFLLLIVMLGAYLFVRSGGRHGESRGELRLVSFGIFWFFIALSVESSLIPIVDLIYEHRTYLPSAGFLIACVAGVAMMVQKVNSRAAVKVISAVVIAAVVSFSGATYARNRVWQSEIGLWEDAVKKSPSKDRPHYNLGVAYTTEGRTDDAIKQFIIAIQITPDYYMAHNHLGLAYKKQGRIKDAIKQFIIAIDINPAYARPHNNIGIIYFEQGRTDEAMKEFLTAIRINPSEDQAHRNLGILYIETGRLKEALREFQIANELAPDNIKLRESLEMLKEMIK